ncbi:MAG: ribosome biogenesis GTPase YlqF [Solobacterium sp.]|nr:ribosome biogenesis GTPase YlqF [Solobacterium sp.]
MVAVQWYPGHMEKARRDMQDALKQVDMVIEIRDARIPNASRNPMLDKMIGDKPRLIILSKSDLADEKASETWAKALSTDSQKAVYGDLVGQKRNRQMIINECLELTKKKRDRMIARGIRPRAMRAMACGIPNVGKSTLINLIASKTRAKTADKPGVTRSLSWIHASDQLDILDTPGVLWPKFDDERTGVLLAALGSINEDILNTTEIALYVINDIQELYPGLLEKAFEAPEGTEKYAMLEQIARQRHLVKTGDELDTERAADVFLHELRKAKYGKLTLEMPE